MYYHLFDRYVETKPIVAVYTWFTISLLLEATAEKDCLLQSNKQYLALAGIKDTNIINF